MSTPERITEVLLPIVKALVLSPESVRTDVREKDRSIVVVFAVEPSDRGRLLGKQGKILQALRLIAQSIATLHDRNCFVELDESR